MGRYFFEFSGFERISGGEVSIVVGRKGSGKTAIVNYLMAQQDYQNFCNKITFGEFPFEEFSAILSKDFLSATSFSLAWKWAIYNSILDNLSKQPYLDASANSALSERRAVGVERRFSDTFKRWTSSSITLGASAPLLGGANVGKSSHALDRRPATLAEQVRTMEDFIIEHCADSKYFIVFDGLDAESPIQSVDPEKNKMIYNSILSSLFRSCLEVRELFRSLGKSIIPIAFVRDDIFQGINDSNKEKWSDHTYHLIWRVDQITNLLVHRICRATDPDMATLPIEKAWDFLFRKKENVKVTHKRKIKEINVINYILLRSLRRPRDFVRYLQICARVTKEQASHRTRMSADVVVNSEYEYSRRFFEEMKDEVSFFIPKFPEVMQAFDRLKDPRNFLIEEFQSCLDDVVAEGYIDELPFKAERLLQLMFRFSIVGNVRTFYKDGESARYRTFYFSRPTSSLILKRHMTVHSGLYPALCPSHSGLNANLADRTVIDDADPPEEILESEVFN